MKFKVDSDACQSATTCIAFTIDDQKIYELDDENKASIITKDNDKIQDKWVDIKNVNGAGDIKEDELEKIILDSAKGCPFNAIMVENDKGKQIWPEN